MNPILNSKTKHFSLSIAAPQPINSRTASIDLDANTDFTVGSPTSAQIIQRYEEQNESKKKLASSKYDFVKVRVWLKEHYYILSRFIVSRMLLVTQVSYKDSIKIALELKKRLVDLDKLDVAQEELEQHLFEIMRSYGYVDEIDHGGVSSALEPLPLPPPSVVTSKKPPKKKNCIFRYKMMTAFHHKRVPLMIILFGSGCVGKSVLATQLAERLNIPNVLQTDIVWDLLCTVKNTSTTQPAWLNDFCSQDQFLEQYKTECKEMRHALEGDIDKCFNDGKSIIIEGSQLDPALFKDLIQDCNMSSVQRENQKPKGLIIPFYLSMTENDHMLFLEQWLCSRHGTFLRDKSFEQKLNTLYNNFKTIDEYLGERIQESYTSSTVVNSLTSPVMVQKEGGLENLESSSPSSQQEQPNQVDICKLVVNLHQIEKTLNSLHNFVLEKIEQIYNQGLF